MNGMVMEDYGTQRSHYGIRLMNLSLMEICLFHGWFSESSGSASSSSSMDAGRYRDYKDAECRPIEGRGENSPCRVERASSLSHPLRRIPCCCRYSPRHTEARVFARDMDSRCSMRARRNLQGLSRLPAGPGTTPRFARMRSRPRDGFRRMICMSDNWRPCSRRPADFQG